MAFSPIPVRNSFVSGGGGRPVVAGNALGVASMLAWAAGFPAAEILLQSWPPLALITARLLLVAVVMVPVWIVMDGGARVLGARWARAMWIGAVGFGAGSYLLLLAQFLTDPVTVALFASCAPVVAACLELAARSRRFSWNFALGVAASVIGGLIATSALAPAQLGLGAVCVILSTVCFLWASLAATRDLPDLGQTGRVAITMVGGLLAVLTMCAITAAIGIDLRPRLDFDAHQAGMLAVYALVATGLSQVLFLASISRLGVAVATLHMNVAPFYVMIIMVLLGASWNWPQAYGAAIVAVGVVLAQDRRTGYRPSSSAEGMT